MNITDMLTVQDINELEYLCKYLCESKPWGVGDHVMDSWRVTIREVDFEYHTGTGHRRKNVPVAPELAGLLSCLLSEMELAAGTFADFCEMCDCSSDSRKALESYLKCQDTAAKLRRIFSAGELKHFSSILENY